MRGAKRRKRLPERQKVKPGAEAAFGDDKMWTRVLVKAVGKLISAKKNVPSFFQSVIIRKVDVVKISGNRCTLIVKFEVGGAYGDLFHVSYSHSKASDDLNDVCEAAQIYALIV